MGDHGITGKTTVTALPNLKLAMVVEQHLKCIFCETLELMPWRMACGHLLCNECLEEIHFGSSNCPIDGALVSRNTIHKNVDGNQTLQNLVIQCPNHEMNECDELIPLHQVKDHYKICLENSVSCPRNCGKKLAKTKIEDHLRTSCSAQLTAAAPTTEEMDVKDSKLRSGAANGSLLKEREQPGLAKFMNESNLMLSDNGFQPSTHDFSEASTYQHRLQIELLRDTILTLEMRFDQLARSTHARLLDIQESLNSLKETLSASTGLQEKAVEDHSSEIQKLQLKLDETVQFLGELDKDKRRKKSTSDKQDDHNLNLMNYSGTFLWKVSEYSRLKRESCSDPRKVDEMSPPFYSELYGYKMCAAIDIYGDGTGRGTHLSVYVCLVKGPYDDVLSWPFQQKVTFILMDQSESRDKSHIVRTLVPDPSWPEFRKPITDKNLGRGFHKFVPHVTIEGSDTYLRNDNVYLKVLIDDAIVL